ncbi:hypothetical protein [Amycolatopsis pithecellobii]|uniref:Uncharacterized protein n=1 Tax=Amycolatopsis pithecellobii TaxID=664692 RepID=A0A6N7Z4E4_9PSEU|nr:hypothetical protein [Amycolatopsis pithecellobii]MTD55291.1 hypothetical protein [Amycolatopsis pithecellobii]
MGEVEIADARVVDGLGVAVVQAHIVAPERAEGVAVGGQLADEFPQLAAVGCGRMITMSTELDSASGGIRLAAVMSESAP